MKVIFLDIDGVLNSDTDFFELKKFGHHINQAKGCKVINRGHLALLQQLIEDTDAKIVVSSTWRLQYSLDDIYDMFIQRDFSLPRDVIFDSTPIHSRGFSDYHYRYRGGEIREYLKSNQHIEKYVILDDVDTPITNPDGRYEDNSLLWENRVPYEGFIKVDVGSSIDNNENATFIHTNHMCGLTVDLMKIATSILGLGTQGQQRKQQHIKDLELLLSCSI